MVFQTYALYPHMTVARNIEYPLKKRRVPKIARKEKVADVARLLEIETLLARKPAELSGGQQQRVALGRALVRDPAVFLLDEPLSNLDAKLRSHMRVELIQLQRNIARTMIYVTHDQLEAMTMSNRIAVLRDGRMQQFASPREVYTEPANEFVASFIGTPAMNIVGGQLSDSSITVCAEWRFDLIGKVSLPDQPVRAGFRPEDLLFDEGGVEATISVVEPTGHELIVMLDVQGHEIVARRPPDSEMRSGDIVTVRPRPDRVLLFDAQSGVRLTHRSKNGQE
jgi:ABC-type sugar transport system ATPase subunit